MISPGQGLTFQNIHFPLDKKWLVTAEMDSSRFKLLSEKLHVEVLRRLPESKVAMVKMSGGDLDLSKKLNRQKQTAPLARNS